MTSDEIERLARDGRPLPQYTTLPDACYYETIRALWDAVRSGRITKEEAHDRKRRMLRQYAEYRAGYDNACSMYRRQQEQIRRSERLRILIAKAESTEEKLRYSLQLIALLTGDAVLEQAEINRMEGIT